MSTTPKKTLKRFQRDANLAEGLRRREDGFRRVVTGAGGWWDEAVGYMREHHDTFPDESFTAEIVHERVKRMFGDPPHVNTWGALIALSIRRGWLVQVPGTRAITRPQAHAHQTPLYVKPDKPPDV